MHLHICRAYSVSLLHTHCLLRHTTRMSKHCFLQLGSSSFIRLCTHTCTHRYTYAYTNPMAHTHVHTRTHCTCRSHMSTFHPYIFCLFVFASTAVFSVHSFLSYFRVVGSVNECMPAHSSQSTQLRRYERRPGHLWSLVTLLLWRYAMIGGGSSALCMNGMCDTRRIVDTIMSMCKQFGFWMMKCQ